MLVVACHPDRYTVPVKLGVGETSKRYCGASLLHWPQSGSCSSTGSSCHRTARLERVGTDNGYNGADAGTIDAWSYVIHNVVAPPPPVAFEVVMYVRRPQRCSSGHLL